MDTSKGLRNFILKNVFMQFAARGPKKPRRNLAALRGKDLGGFLETEQSGEIPWGSRFFKPPPGHQGERIIPDFM